MDCNNRYTDIKETNAINNRNRGDILYYSISQVANLLGENDSNIRYYTNVFDNILKIEITNKEFRYTNKDIDKLEFLINLKNKGMTIKEIQNYCEELPLDIEELIEPKENSPSSSIKEIITTIVGLENKEISDLKNYLSRTIKENNDLTIHSITNLLAEQDRKLEFFKEDLLNEIKKYIDYKLSITHDTNKALCNELSSKIDNFVSEKLSLEDNINLQFDKFNEVAASRDIALIDEIRKFKNVMESAYYMQQEMDALKPKERFIDKLFGAK